MKRIFSWQVVLGIMLILLSAIVYYIHFLIFHDAHHIFIYLLGDIGFVFFIVQWLRYMKHLKIEYPYLFSLAIRTNPLNPDACVEIKNA